MTVAATTAKKSSQAPSTGAGQAPAKPLTLRVSDVTGQKLMRVRIPAGDKETTVNELIENMRGRMQLQKEANGRALTYSARLEREGRHLQGSERVADAVREDDLLVLSPSIDAG